MPRDLDGTGKSLSFVRLFERPKGCFARFGFRTRENTVSNQEVIAFISVEDEAPDLLVSFALEPNAYRSITLLRTPAYESFLSEEERGVAILAGAQSEDRELLLSIALSANSVVFESSARRYSLSWSRVAEDQKAETLAMLKRMNFDNRFVINAV